MFTKQEIQILLEMVHQVQVRPTAPDAINLVTTLQSIANKLTEEQEKTK